MSRLFSILIALLLGLSAVAATAADAATGFEAANRQYEKGDFAGAAKAYAALLDQGQHSSAVLFNLGNAHFKAGQLGAAIAAYRRAEALAPRDPDIRANLQFAREKVAGDTHCGAPAPPPGSPRFP
jgi:Flp pilus assembly protein TadD